ncbi:hypothetical protein FSP39_020910 [Pinctada imbricata]|uniref:SWIM-type domain-containing protein n=1 Tax=Pinctada imbricata TaxID=66713 RepID=A0AA88YEW9_PINIB|nr:hypothetical protein FSP39_020910 [Pinctada imbricata]
MSSDSDSSDESRQDLPSLSDLEKWSIKDLKYWLQERDLKRSGKTKQILAKRVYRALHTGRCSLNSDSENEDIESSSIYTNRQVFSSKYSELDSTSWETAAQEKLPQMSNKQVENYFMLHKDPFSSRSAKFIRHFRKGRKLCNENYVSHIMYHPVDSISDICYIKANCKPSMRTSVQVAKGKMATFYSLYVCLSKSTGHIIFAFCNCKAGEAGLCAHVGGLLFSVLKIKNACTSQQCRWEEPRHIQRKPSPKRVHEIRFVNSEGIQQTKIRPYPDVHQASACKDPDTFLVDLLHGLQDINPTCVLYKTLKAEPADISLFTDLFNPKFCYADHVNLAAKDCKLQFHRFMDSLVVGEELSKNVELGTKGQALNQNWIDARKCILTASNFGAICKRRKPEAEALISNLRGYREIPNNVKSISHGRKYEQQALKEYAKDHQQICNGAVSVEDCGIMVNPKFPFLGASVDGKVHCDKCGIGIVEVKCPYGSKQAADVKPWREILPEKCATDQHFYCTLENGKVKLKPDHNYMFQIQGQLAICEKPWVDFVIWTKKGISCERYLFDEKMWEEMLPKLKNFYLLSFVPELFSLRVKRGLKLF